MGVSKSIQFVNHHFPSHHYQWQSLTLTNNPSPITTNNKIKQPSIDININNNNKTITPHNKCNRVIDKISLQIGQQYTINEYDSLQYQLETLLFRKHHSHCIVAVKHVVLSNTNVINQSTSLSSSLSSSLLITDCMLITANNNKPFTIILQSIPYRLSDIGMLRYQQMIYVMQQCFKALNLLSIQFNARTFYLDQDLICFNNQGQCKIWINQNLYKNKPNIQANFLPKTIIQQIFLLLQSRVDQSSITQSYYHLKSITDFQKFIDAIQFIRKVKKLQKININCIKSLKQQLLSTDYLKASHNINRKNQNHLQKYCRNKSSDHNKSVKYSLKNNKNSKNIILANNLHKNNATPKTAVSKQQQTQVSIKQLQRLNAQQIQIGEYLRATYKSDRLSQQRIIRINNQNYQSYQEVIFHPKEETYKCIDMIYSCRIRFQYDKIKIIFFQKR